MITKRLLLTLLTLTVIISAEAQPKRMFWKKKKIQTTEMAADSVKKKSDYDKLFKKQHSIAEGVIKLHLMDGKLYFEMPLSLMEREMLIGTTVTEISDNGNAIVGSKPSSPMHIKFTKTDKQVQLRAITDDYITDDSSSGIANAIKLSNIGAIIRNMKIDAYSPDSLAVVFDITDFFLGGNKSLTPFDSFSYYTLAGFKRNENYLKEKSFINEIKSFEDNAVVKTTLSYKYSLSDRNGKQVVNDEPFTAIVTNSIVLLDTVAYRPRLGDSRMSVFPTGKYMLESNGSGVKNTYYSNRWRLEPTDEEAYKRGELTQPKKQIVFYIDNNFPDSWKPSVKIAVEQWNEMFETVGFKNAIVAKDFPTDDPEFDPDNLKYSCIRYAPIGIANAMGPSWTDPRSGEIFTASVYVYHDIIKLLRNWMFVQTAQTDDRVRHIKLSDEMLHEGLRYVISHEVGHCLGYMHNMSASYQIPVDSLRSPSYTALYGTTTSIMDYARFNYVAQPGDYQRGVKMMPPHFGLYDRYAVKWLYTFFPESTPEQERDTLLRWLNEASKNPLYRYGRQLGSIIDPRSQTEDLGNDAIKASTYGISNLKYIIEHLNEWTAKEDKDLEFRTEIFDEIVMQYITYINHIYAYIGGLYLQEYRPGDDGQPFAVVPKQKQREALKFICNQLGTINWLDNKELMAEIPIMGSAAQLIENSICDAIIQAPAKTLRFGTIGENNYSFDECSKDIFDFIWAPARSGRKLTQTEMRLQLSYIKYLAINAGVGKKASPQPAAGITATDRNIRVELPVEFTLPSNTYTAADMYETAGYSGIRTMYMGKPNNAVSTLYGYLKRSLEVVKNGVRTSKGETQAHYKYLEHYITNSLNEE